VLRAEKLIVENCLSLLAYYISPRTHDNHHLSNLQNIVTTSARRQRINGNRTALMYPVLSALNLPVCGLPVPDAQRLCWCLTPMTIVVPLDFATALV
jgi:hypothetical protein